MFLRVVSEVLRWRWKELGEQVGPSTELTLHQSLLAEKKNDSFEKPYALHLKRGLGFLTSSDLVFALHTHAHNTDVHAVLSLMLAVFSRKCTTQSEKMSFWNDWYLCISSYPELL